jgi:exodeoxyribonuclease VII small subunit
MDSVKRYSEAVEELEKIVAILQSDNCKIDELKTYAQKSVELIKFCKSHLTQTDEEVKKLLENIEG